MIYYIILYIIYLIKTQTSILGKSVKFHYIFLAGRNYKGIYSGVNPPLDFYFIVVEADIQWSAVKAALKWSTVVAALQWNGVEADLQWSRRGVPLWSNAGVERKWSWSGA